METNIKINNRTHPWEYRFEDDEATYVWKYDNRKNQNGPYQVDIQYKKPPVKNRVKRTNVKLKK